MKHNLKRLNKIQTLISKLYVELERERGGFFVNNCPVCNKIHWTEENRGFCAICEGCKK